MKQKKLVILTIAKLTDNKTSGINTNVPIYVKILNNYCHSACLDCGNTKDNNFNGYENYFKLSDYQNFDLKKMPAPFNHPDLVVFQELYRKEYIEIAKKLRKENISYTIIPRCSMTQAAQKQSFVKKIIGNLFLFNTFVKNASFIHFLTNNEYLESKKSFKFKDKVVIGNGFNTPNIFYEPHNRKEYKVLYIGRYDIYHKGLDILLEAVGHKKDFFEENNFKFIFYGKKNFDRIEKINLLISKYDISNLVEFNDEIYGNEKEKAILDCDMFIHTSRLEGHPTSVIEAISYGVPVFVTPGTNVIDEVQEANLGFVSEFNFESIAFKLIEAYQNRSNYNEISKNCIAFAKENYNWDNIARKIIEEYTKFLKDECKK